VDIVGYGQLPRQGELGRQWRLPSGQHNRQLLVVPSQTDSFFSVNSNSTLSALTFDSEAKQLGFSVSGPKGTTGYMEVYIPKRLMSNISGLPVTLDGNPLQYCSQSKQDVWLVSFSYHHSNHEVSMQLNGAQLDNVGSLYGWILVVAIIIPLATVLAVLTLKKSKPRKHATPE